jgi:hypothetical protein
MSVPSLLSIFGNSGGEDPVYVDDVFSTYLYEGDAVGGSDTKTINNGIDLDGKGGLVWIKSRDAVRDNILADTERGATNALVSNSSASTQAGSKRVQVFNNNGFRIGADTDVNVNGEDFASWSFRKAPGFFDVVTYTDGGGGSATIPHSLDSVPGAILVKSLSSGAWQFYHKDMISSSPQNYAMQLNERSPRGTLSVWNNTAPTSTHFSVGNNLYENGNNYVAYLFADSEASFGTDEDESIIKCGSYTGNGTGSSSTNDINLGFEPQWILIKCSSSGQEDWIIADTMRGSFDPGSSYDNMRYLRPNITNNEAATKGAEPTSTGFKVRGAFGPTNVSGRTYIYMAIRRPNKPPEAGTDVFAIDNQTTGTKPPQYHSNFVVDMAFYVAFGEPQQYRDRLSFSRLMGPKRLLFNEQDAETNFSSAQWDYMDGWFGNNSSVSTTYSWMFKRAPGFFDVVAYTGTGSSHNINHNLTVPPELIIAKNRSTSGTRNTMWSKYLQSDGVSGKWLSLDSYDIAYSGTKWRVNSHYTSTVFGVGTDDYTNKSGDNYISYLFASLDGISKVGTYSGTGNAINVDCGFTNGARFIMIKRTDTEITSGVPTYAYVWDTLRGIVSGNDPYFAISTDDAEVTNTDYIDPLSTGFTVTSSAPAALNTSGGTYLFLAIA